MKDSLSVILPVFNEEANIVGVVSEVTSYLRQRVTNFEIIIIDDGSTDTTVEVIKKINHLYSETTIFSNKVNEGYGAAIKTGIFLSRKEWVFIMDADGQFRIEDFEAFWNNKKSYNFIIGYRRKRKDNLYRIILAECGNLVANLLLGKRIKDINCGFKLFKYKELRNLKLLSTGGCIYFEILFCLLNSRTNNAFLQVPVEHYKRNKGRQTGGCARVILRNIFEGVKVVTHK